MAAQFWRVAVGLYDLSSGARLPVTGPQGAALPDSQVIAQP